MNGMMKVVALAALVAAGCSWVPCGKPDAVATSPDGLNRIALVRRGGALKITSYRRDVPVMTATFAGLDYLGSDKGPNPARDGIVGVTTNVTAGVRKTPVYKRAEISLAGNRTTVDFARGWSIELAARNDGVAWRVVTSGDGKEQVEIAAERTEFSFPDDGCWTWPGYGRKGQFDRFQWGFQPANAKVRADAMRVDDGTCATIQCLPLMSENPATGKWATITESDIRDYPSMQLVRPSADAVSVRATFAAYPSKTKYTGRFYRVLGREKFIARTSAARAFPWRVTLLGDTAGELTDSDCVAALAPGPDEGADFSWVKPGIVAWDWWNDWNLAGVDFKPGIDTRTYKYYIDFASRHGIPYVILDEGWSEKLDVTRVQKDIDLPELIRYGRARGVEIILWCAWAQLPGRQDEIFSKYAKMGVRGFKIDFMNRDDQEIVNFLEETARIAAKYRFHVDYHGMFKPYGLEQRYPNILSYEGVHGLEELKWVKHRDMPVIDCQHYFLRMSAGPMDYTPGAMLNRTREGWKASNHSPCSQGTRCHQVALLPLYFSPLQMMADSPTNYEANEECSRFMAGVPTAWDETRTLGGRPGEWAAVARRKGGTWWIGAINAWEAREVELNLSFLGAGEWTAETFEDAPDAATSPERYVRRTDVKVGRALKVRFAPGGGFAAKIENRADAKRSARRPLRVVYFTPSDCEPCPDRAERLCRVMKYVQDFYRRGMMRNGHGLQTFALEETVPGRLKLHEVRGKLKQAEYDRKSFGKVRDEVSAALKAEGLDVSKERMVVFQRGLRWEGEGNAIEVSSYVGSWNSTWGMCTVYDDSLLDPDNFASTAPGGSYCGKPCSVGKFNSHYIGGVAHELGHALTLPHDGQTAEERQTLGRSLMGAGNHSFGQEHRGEGPGTFLTATDALRLSSVSTFNGGEPVSRPNDVTLAFASTTEGEGRLRVKGRVTAARPIKGLLVYVDPDEPKSDYDAQTWIVKPGKDGAFDTVLTGVPTAPSALRVWAVRDCDSVKVHTARLD